MMKKYLSLGELLIDYRKFASISQSEFAANLDVDIRSVIRWEKDQTLIKSEKEIELAESSFIPLQVIRNLNTVSPITTYYDFRIRKYALSEITQHVPDVNWYKTHIDALHQRVRPIESEKDILNILKTNGFIYPTDKPIRKEIIKEAVKVLPELNFMITDNQGLFTGYSVIFPLRASTYEKLKDKSIEEGDIQVTDLINYRLEDSPIFYIYDIYADSNENDFYMMGAFLKFFKNLIHNDYILVFMATNQEGADAASDMGLEKVWEDSEEQKKYNLDIPPTLFEGKLCDFLSG